MLAMANISCWATSLQYLQRAHVQRSPSGSTVAGHVGRDPLVRVLYFVARLTLPGGRSIGHRLSHGPAAYHRRRLHWIPLLDPTTSDGRRGGGCRGSWFLSPPSPPLPRYPLVARTVWTSAGPMVGRSTDEPPPPCGGSGAARSAAASAADVRPLAAVCEHLRDDRGTFLAAARRCRKRQAPNFLVIELQAEESKDCGAVFQDGGAPRKCRSPFQCQKHGGTRSRRWLIRGPGLGFSDDAENLTTLATVRPLAELPVHEVYVRSVPHLVPLTFKTTRDAAASVRFVIEDARSDGDLDTAAPTFNVVLPEPLSDDCIVAIVARARRATRVNPVLSSGAIAMRLRTDARSDPYLKAAVKQARRNRSSQSIQYYRRQGSNVMRTRLGSVIHGIAAGAVGRMRHMLELMESASGGGRRATFLRLARGLSQMHLLPTRLQLQEARRPDLDASDRVRHFLFTQTPLGEVQQWQYVLGSASTGVRHYMASCGQVKRLQSHTNHYGDARNAERVSSNDVDASEGEDGG